MKMMRIMRGHWKWGLLSLMVVAVMAALLAWSHSGFQQAAAQEGAKTGMDLVVSGIKGGEPVECNSATSAKCTLDLDSQFTLSISFGPIPIGGYAFFQTQVDYGILIYIGAIVQRLFTAGDPNGDPLVPPQDLTSYHVSADRSPPIGPNLWNAGPPDGTIDIIEIGLAVVQFGHTCN